MFLGDFATIIAFAAEEAESQLTRVETLELTFIVALVFSAIHIWSEKLYGFLYKSERVAVSFGGGMAVTYVFIHLMPELEKGSKLLGIGVHFITLIGFLIFYGIQHYCWRIRSRSLKKNPLIFYLNLGFYCIYNGLLIYVIPELFDRSLLFIFLYIFAMSLHLISADRSLSEDYSHEFKSWGRYVLVASVIAGLTIDIFTEPANELVSDVLTAILAGSLMFNIFKDELPNPENSSFRWFCGGVGLYLILLVGASGFVS